MEIGTEISRKIRGAIKGKLQELGAYVDEELPDYIMVMVANKKTQEQMTDDLSLFLGSSTIKFTVWLHGVLEKLRSATSDPNSQKSTDAIIFESSMPSNKNVSASSEDGMPDDPGLSISRTRVERLDSRVSTSSLGQGASYVRQHSEDGSASRLTSAVKPMRDLAPSEAIIDIQPNADDLIDEDLNYVPENPVLPQKKPTTSPVYGSSRPSAALYRPPGSSLQQYQGPEFVTRSQRLPQASVQPDRLPDSQNCRSLETIKQYDPEGFGHAAEVHRTTTKSALERDGREEGKSRKRKLQYISSVVKVKTFNSDGQEEEEDEDDEEEDDDHGSRPASLPSSVSVPAKPERRPTLPPYKQANKNLILKAISEAQESVTKTTSYTTVPQKQTVPVAPRTRLPQDDPVKEMICAQNALSRPSYIAHVELPMPSYNSQAELPASNYLIQVKSSKTNYLTSTDDPRPSYLTQVQPLTESGIERLQGTHQRQELFSRLRPDPTEEASSMNREVYEEDTQPLDSRSFILKRPKLSEEIATQNQPIEKMAVEGVQSQPGRLIKSREPIQPEKPASPKFIVTLDGVPSPPGYGSDQEETMEYIEEGQQTPKQNGTNLDKKANKLQVQQRISRQPNSSDGDEEDHCAPAKQKISERCKYWPACKNGDTCVYHHPTAPCKAFPKCRFAEKCLFIHPNCKYDAKCTKPDCPYTHASRRQPMQPAEGTAPVCHVPYCRYDTQCTKQDCPYMHGSQLNHMLLPKKSQAPASSSTTQQCKFFPACKNMDCPFYHPKPCRYNTQCQRPDCTFYHPASSVPPRHALKWTRSQTSE